MSTAQDHIADTLNRAQHCWETMTDPLRSDEKRLMVNLFIYHVTTAVLLENLRRHQPGIAELVTKWLCADGSVFEEGLAGELLFQWRAQLASGHEMEPIAPSTDGSTPA